MTPLPQLAFPFLRQTPGLAEALDGVRDFTADLEAETRTPTRHSARFRTKHQDMEATVELIQDPAVRDVACAVFSGADAADVAFALATVLPYLPLPLVARMAGGLPTTDGKLGALRLLSQAAILGPGPWSQRHVRSGLDFACSDQESAVREFAAEVRRRLGLSPGAMAPAGRTPSISSLPFLPLEPLAVTLSRFPSDFSRRPYEAGSVFTGVEGWELRDAGGHDASVCLIADLRWSVGCAHYRGSEITGFAAGMANALRYLPLDLAAESAVHSRSGAARARAVAAIGLAGLSPDGQVAPTEPEASEALAAAARDPDESVRGLATLFALLPTSMGSSP